MESTIKGALSGLNWDDLRFFLALCRRQSFVTAAIELETSHTTVARRITALETSLQSQLLQRSTKGCTLTPAGEMLLPYADHLETTFIHLQEAVSGKNSQLVGTVRVGAPDGFGNFFLTSNLIKLRALYPELEIELLAAPKYYSLSKREVDILITISKPTVESVVTRKLTTNRFGLFATEKYLRDKSEIRNKDDLQEHGLIGYIDELVFDQGMMHFEEIKPGLIVHFRSSSLVTQINAVLSDGGIGVLPYFIANKIEELVPVLPEITLDRALWLQVNPDSRQLARVRTTIDFLVNQIEKNRDQFLSLST